MKTTPKQQRAFSGAAYAIARYLHEIGWTSVVVGSPRIQDPDPGDMNYEFVVRFTGGERSGLAPAGHGSRGVLSIPLRSRVGRGGYLFRVRR